MSEDKFCVHHAAIHSSLAALKISLISNVISNCTAVSPKFYPTVRPKHDLRSKGNADLKYLFHPPDKYNLSKSALDS